MATAQARKATNTRSSIHSTTRKANTRSNATRSPKSSAGLKPFQSRPELPQQLLKFARNMQDMGFSIERIRSIINDPKSPRNYRNFPTLPKGFNPKNVNYYDVWKHLGTNTRAMEKEAARKAKKAA
jgi:hypothetical protein